MRRWSLLAVVPIAFAAFVLPGAVAADNVLSAPTALSMARPGATSPLAPGSWINLRKVNLRFQAQVSTNPVTPQVEIQPSGTPFSDQPNFTGAVLSASGQAVVHASGLVNGKTYHWQARVASSADTSPWVSFSSGQGSVDIGVDKTPPTRPLISSPTDPNQNNWYNTKVPVLHWTSKDTISGIAGYTWQLQRNPHVIPPGNPLDTTGVRISNLADGVWFFALRSVDQAGNWSPTATFRLQLDRRPPAIALLSPHRFTFNPYRGPTTISFRVNKPASARLDLYRVGNYTPTATFWFAHAPGGRTISFQWNGRDAHGNPVQPGFYYFSVSLTDRASNLAHLDLGAIDVRPQKALLAAGGVHVYPGGGKVIIVVLHEQVLYAYNGTHLDLRTLVTTGNPALPTPTGNYSVIARYHPFEFISPWPEGSPFYYPPSWTQWALLFRSDGYFLHDAPWRSNFGPGSNSQLGTPGQNYTGTHGCVNIPTPAMQFLWNWTPNGTPVDVVP